MTFLLTFSVMMGGFALSYCYDRSAGLLARLSAGLISGMAVWGLLGYFLAWTLSDLTRATTVIAALPLLTPLTVFFFSDARRRLRQDILAFFSGRKLHNRWFILLALSAFAALLLWLFTIVFYQANGEWHTDNHYNLGDLPFHLAITQEFVVGKRFPPQHPEFAGVNLTYPFLVDFIPAQYAVWGISLPAAYALQNIPLALALLILLFRWSLKVTRNRIAALTSLPLMFLCGGLGFVLLFRDIYSDPQGIVRLFWNLPHDYTRDSEDALAWGNVLTTLLMTQRGMLFALPLALLTLTLLQGRGKAPLFAAGCIVGLIPLLHGHTFLAMLLVAGTWAAWDLLVKGQWRRLPEWFGFFASAILLATPQILILASGSAVRPGTFFGYQPGWDIGDGNLKWFVPFWLWNLGLFLPLLLAAFYLQKPNGKQLLPWRLGAWYLPFTLLFILPNIFRFAPWVWDNIKILIYFYLGSVPVVSLVMASLWNRPRWGKIIAGLTLFLLCFSGALDIWRVASRQQEHLLFNRDDLAFSTFLQENTPRDARILHAPYYAHPALLAGRSLLLGYEGHLWSHGLDYIGRSEDMKKIYSGKSDADALIRKWRIQYVIVGPPERNEQSFKLNAAYFERYPLVGTSGPYRLYRIPDSP